MSKGVGKRNWRDPLGYRLALEKWRSEKILYADDWDSLDSVAKLCVDPAQSRVFRVFLLGPPPRKVEDGFIEILQEIYNVPVYIWHHRKYTRVVFYVDAHDTYLGVKVAADLYKIVWRHT